MAIVQDLKELPKDEPKLQKWSLYSLLVSFVVSIAMTLWYFIRLNQSGSNRGEISWFWSIVHVGAYIPHTVVIGLGLFGAYYPKPKFIGWYLIGTLILIIAEFVCIFWNLVLSAQHTKVSIIVVFFKALAVIVFIVTAVLGFLWKRYIDSHPIKEAVMAYKTDQKVTETKEALKEEKSGDSSKSDKNKSKA